MSRWPEKVVEIPANSMLVGGVLYWADKHGILHQEKPKEPFVYDRKYVEDRYDTIPEVVRRMSHLRLGYVSAAVGQLARKCILDVGYGNGDFLALCHEAGAYCYGTDVSGYPLPEGCKEVAFGPAMAMRWDLATFFDSAEHFESLDFLKRIQAQHIAVTAPWLHDSIGQEAFKHWKHRRPGEHLHHFSPDSLRSLMESLGYEEFCTGSPEDVIRKPDGPLPNTFSSIFRKR